MKKNHKLETVYHIIDDMIISIYTHQMYEDESQNHLTLLEYNRKKNKMIEKKLVKIKDILFPKN